MSGKTKQEKETKKEKRHIHRRRKKRLRKTVSYECPDCKVEYSKEARHKPDGSIELFWPTHCRFCGVRLQRKVVKN